MQWRTQPPLAGLPTANLCSFQSAISKREDLCRTENQYLIFRITLTAPSGTGRPWRLAIAPLPSARGTQKNRPQPPAALAGEYNSGWDVWFTIIDFLMSCVFFLQQYTLKRLSRKESCAAEISLFGDFLHRRSCGKLVWIRCHYANQDKVHNVQKIPTQKTAHTGLVSVVQSWKRGPFSPSFVWNCLTA